MSETPLSGVNPLVPAKRQIVRWVDGVPVVDAVPMVAPSLIKDIQKAALAQLYSEDDDEIAIALGFAPSPWYGRPLIEVMLLKQALNAARTGAYDEIEAIRDRVEGKPLATSVNHNINENYEQATNRIADAEKKFQEQQRTQAVDAEIVTPESDVLGQL